MRTAPIGSERGVALVISLVLLVALSLLAVSTLSSTRLNERIASNAQQKAIAFEVAQSAIELAATVTEIDRTIVDMKNSGVAALNNPAAVPRDDFAPVLSTGFDQTNAAGKSLDVEGRVSIQFCGSAAPRGTSLDADISSGSLIVDNLFDVNGVATIANSATRADNVQRVAKKGPATGRTGNCLAP